MAKKLVLSQSTVKTHMRNLYAKLEVHSQSDLYLFLESTAKASSQEEFHDRR
ncbi:LuxR C-terminal-related transcriptional regulator [uncultured Slackia sp.]|uniref:LuxR C-terminal-related transcriptional regulator n=1 Tax=uncultured Slackia sp. TaxID=665903 RepID=UPI00260CA2BB|nr:LuxR C-terminal-related transcriptional regulator [uncultured Slackia sp.]